MGGFKDPEDGGKRIDSLGERLQQDRLGTDFGPWRFPCVSFSILGWLLLVREFSASHGKPSEAGAGSAWLPRALPPPWVPSSPWARGTPRVGTLAHPHGGHPFPGLCAPPSMFPSCDPTGLLDLGPRRQAADVKPWQRPKRGRGNRIEGALRVDAGEARNGTWPEGWLQGDCGSSCGKSRLRVEEGRAVDARPRAGRAPAVPSTLAVGPSEPPSSLSVKIRAVYHHGRGLRRLCS